jgi:hypothetical protein
VVEISASDAQARKGRSAECREALRLSRLLPCLIATAACVALAIAPARADAGAPIGFGVYVPKADRNPALLDSFADRVGRDPAIVSSYKRWRFPPFVHTELQAMWSRGAVPLVTWEPWTLAGRGSPLKAIARGRYDRYVRHAASSAAAWGHPILLRFAHEMNGTWYPWGRRPGNSPGIYKAAWRHLVTIFRSAGADNVEWLWAPNVEGGGQYPFRRLYPGDRWVDWVGLDGFNWAKRGEWQSLTEIFGSSVDTLSRITSRPVIIAETGSSQDGGNKAAWVSSALDEELPRLPGVRAIVWFSDPVGDVDFRVTSSPASFRAFRTAIDSPEYGLTRRALLSTPANVGQRTAAPSPPSGDYGEPSLLYRVTQKLHGRYLWIAIGLLATFLSLLTLLLAWVARSRRKTSVV